MFSRLCFQSVYFTATVLFLGSSSVATGAIIGAISVDDYRVVSNDTQGGVNFITHYTLNADFDKQACCKKDDLRWLQLATFSKKIDDFPEGKFIDPQPGQNIGSGQTGDNLPWYDITVAAIGDFSDPTKWNRGTGPYLGDGPFGSWTLGDFSFSVTSVVVCITTDMKVAILGGITWGYSNNATTKTTTKMAAGGFSGDNDAVRGDLNTALGKVDTFKSWTVVKATDAWPVDGIPVVTSVPEPSTLVPLSLCILLVVLHRRHKRVAM